VQQLGGCSSNDGTVADSERTWLHWKPLLVAAVVILTLHAATFVAPETKPSKQRFTRQRQSHSCIHARQHPLLDSLQLVQTCLVCCIDVSPGGQQGHCQCFVTSLLNSYVQGGVARLRHRTRPRHQTMPDCACMQEVIHCEASAMLWKNAKVCKCGTQCSNLVAAAAEAAEAAAVATINNIVGGCHTHLFAISLYCCGHACRHFPPFCAYCLQQPPHLTEGIAQSNASVASTGRMRPVWPYVGFS
jgi:hypothetical protein